MSQKDGVYLDQHCHNCAYNWTRNVMEIIDIHDMFVSKDMSKFDEAITNIDVICPECHSNDTQWTIIPKLTESKYTEEEISLVMLFIGAINSGMKET